MKNFFHYHISGEAKIWEGTKKRVERPGISEWAFRRWIRFKVRGITQIRKESPENAWVNQFEKLTPPPRYHKKNKSCEFPSTHHEEQCVSRAYSTTVFLHFFFRYRKFFLRKIMLRYSWTTILELFITRRRRCLPAGHHLQFISYYVVEIRS